MAPRSRHDPKLDALRKQGALHPSPQKVTDELFGEHDFFDPRDVVQAKYEMLRRTQQDGWSVARAAGSFGLSRPSFYSAQAAFRDEGLPGLLPRKRGPRGAHKLTDAVVDFLLQLRSDEPEIDAKALAQRVHERFERVVHPRSIERALRRRKKRGL